MAAVAVAYARLWLVPSSAIFSAALVLETVVPSSVVLTVFFSFFGGCAVVIVVMGVSGVDVGVFAVGTIAIVRCYLCQQS